ncbi:aldehyde ferredoxin oxidoreductase N-terminal domain-containing protein [candidate division KSB1 bacterium]
MNIAELQKGHQVLAKYQYPAGKIEKGYNNRTLYVNISDNTFKIKEVTDQMKKLFIGGRGFNLWLLWNAVNKDTRWDSPENEICISGGPLCGTSSFPGSGKSIACSISPLTGTPVDSNVGGHFGPLMKFAGFDAIEIQGKAEEDIILVINGITRTLTIETAPLEPVDTHLVAEIFTEMYAEGMNEKQNVSVVSAGSAAENTLMGCLNFSFWDWRRQAPRVKQAGRGGIGSVFRNKKIKALIVKTENLRPKWKIEERIEKPI